MSYTSPLYPAPPPAKPWYKRTWFVVTAAVLGAVLAVCCGAGVLGALGGGKKNPAASVESPAAALSKAPAVTAGAATRSADGTAVTVKVGQSIGMTDHSGRSKVSIVVTKVNTKAKSDNDFTQPKRGQYVAAMVEITAVKGSNDIGPTNFRFIGNDGTVFQAELFVVGIDPHLDAATEIQEGQKKSGYVIFDCLPDKISGGRIEIRPDYRDPIGYWTF